MKTQNTVSRTVQAAAGAALLSGVGLAQAAIDVTSVTTALSDAAGTGGVIGAAVLGGVVVVKVFKYVRGAM